MNFCIILFISFFRALLSNSLLIVFFETPIAVLPIQTFAIHQANHLHDH